MKIDSPTENTEKKTKYSSPIYDGRLEYHQVIKEHSQTIFRFRVNNDYTGWYNSISSLYTLAQPYMRDPQEIKSKLLRIRNYINIIPGVSNMNHRAAYTTAVFTLLEDVTETIYNNAKDLFLKTKSDDADDIDMDAFLRDSEV